MTLTRKTLADAIDAYDAEIETLQSGKRETYAEYRQQLADAGMGKDAVKAEVDATKAAIKRRQSIAKKGNEVIDAKDALMDEIFAEITTGTRNANARVARGARAASDDPAEREARRKMRLSESMLDNIALSADMLRDGLITREQHAENVALSDAVARKLGAGVISPDTGEIIEGNEPASSEAQVRSERSGEGGEDAPALSADTQSQPGRSEAPRQIEAGLVAKVEDQSTAARKDVPGSLPVIENGPVLSDNGGRYPVNGEAKVLAASSEVPGTPAGIKPRPSILTIAFLAPLFDYDPETGFVSWKIDFGTAKAGDRAGHVRPSGYRMIQIDGRRYQEHRIAWVLTHGDLPADGRQIDHANQVKDDNRLANLRAATRAEQQINSPTQSNNLHGRGVGWRADRGVWRADIYVNNARVFLGHFEHREDAQAAYEDAAREYYGEFAPQAPPVDTPKKLIKLAPDRADEIGELLDLQQQREAAQ